MVIDNPDTFGLWMNLLLGPHGGDGEWTEQQLRRGWTAYRSELLKPRLNARPGDRPWAWWHFELGEEQPSSEPEQIVRLLELGRLSAEEVAAARERARESLQGIEAMDRMEGGGHVTTSPRGAAESMRAERDRHAVGWRRVLEAISPS